MRQPHHQWLLRNSSCRPISLLKEWVCSANMAAQTKVQKLVFFFLKHFCSCTFLMNCIEDKLYLLNYYKREKIALIFGNNYRTWWAGDCHGGVSHQSCSSLRVELPGGGKMRTLPTPRSKDKSRKCLKTISGVGHPFFSKECNILAFISVLYKRTEHLLCSS